MEAVQRAQTDPRTMQAVGGTACGLLALWSWLRPLGTPFRGPALALAAVGVLASALAFAVPGRRRLVRSAEIGRSAAFVFVVASWDAPPWWVSAAAALVLGAIDGVTARPGERTLSGVAIGGAIAVAWNAWRFGASPARVFGVVMLAACAVAAMPRHRVS